MTWTLLPSVATSMGRSGQVARDVGEQAAEHEDGAGLGDLGRDGDPGRDLVVEGREGERAVVGGLEEDAGEDRHGRTGRQPAGHPGDRLGQDVALDAELHGLPPCPARRGPRLVVHRSLTAWPERARAAVRRRRDPDTSAPLDDAHHRSSVSVARRRGCSRSPRPARRAAVVGVDPFISGSRRGRRSCGSCGRRVVGAGRRRRAGVWTVGGRAVEERGGPVDGHRAFTRRPPRRARASTGCGEVVHTRPQGLWTTPRPDSGVAHRARWSSSTGSYPPVDGRAGVVREHRVTRGDESVTRSG